jgi:hypothetical protein
LKGGVMRPGDFSRNSRNSNKSQAGFELDCES